MKTSRILRHSIATLLCLTAATSAQTVYTWDADPVTPGIQDGNGAWDLIGQNWVDGGVNSAWLIAPVGSAIFGSGAGGTVTVGAITADDLTFNNAYALTGGTLTLAGTPTITTTADASISAVIAGTDGLTKLGAGQLTLTGPNTFTGTTVLNNGTLVLGSTGGFAINGNVQMGAGVAGNLPSLRMAANEQFGSGVVMTFVNPTGSFPRFELQGTTQSLAGMNDTTGAGVTQNEKFGGGGTAAAGTLTLNGSGTYAYNGYLRDEDDGGHVFKLNLIKAGAGTQTLSGGNITYQGTTTVNGGVLALKDTTAIGSAITVNAGGTLSAVRTTLGGATRSPILANAVTLAGGTLSIDNAGTGLAGGWTTFNAANGLTGSGTININTGVFSRDNTVANAINTSATVNVAAGAFFGAGRGGNSTIGALNGAGVVSTLWSVGNAGSITIGNGDGSGSFSGTLDGNGTNSADLTQQGGVLSVIKTGSGTQTLTGANTYSGATTVNNGSLVIQNLASGSNNANLPGGKVFTTSTLNAATGGTVVVDLGATSLASTNTGLTLLGAGTIRKNGAGIWLLGNGGGGTAISMAAGGLIDVQGGVLKNDYSNANWSGNNGNLNIAVGASVDMRNNSVRVGALTGGGLLDNAFSSAQTLTVGAGGAGGNFTGNVKQTGGGALSVTKIGAGTQTLSGSATSYVGTTTVSQGTLILDGTNLVNASPLSIATGANLTVNYANTTVDTWASSGAITGTGTLTKTGPGWFQFRGSAPANFQGSIVVSEGRFGNGFNTTVWTNSLADVFVASGAELDLRVDDMIVDELTGSGTVINTFSLGGPSDTLTVGSNNGSSQFDGVIRGIGGVGANNTSIDIGRNSLAKIGTGIFTLTGASVYGGTTSVSNGILRISGANDRLPVTTALSVNGGATAGGTFDLNALNQTVSGLLAGSGAVPGVVTNLATGTGTLTVSGTSTFDGTLQDGGAGKILGLTKSGNGTLSLTGINTHSGPTLITGGALREASATALSPNSNVNMNGGIVELGVTDFTAALGAGAGQVQFTGSGGFGAFGGTRIVNIGGAGGTMTWNAGNFVPTGSSLILSGSNSDSTTRFLNPIDLNGAGRIASLGGVAAIDAELAGDISNGNLTLAPGNATIAVTGQISGAVIFESGNTSGNTSFQQVLLNRAGGNAINGSLQIGTSAFTDPVSVFTNVRLEAADQIADTTVVTFGAAQGRWAYLNLNGFDETIAGLSYLAGRDGGVVQLVEADASPATDSTLTLNVTSGTQSYYGHIRDRQNGFSNHPTAGKLNFVKTGAGTQELATWNNQSWSGTTTVTGGTLKLTMNNGASLPGAITVDATSDPLATLEFSPTGANNYNVAGTLSGNGTVVKSGTGTTSLFNATVNLAGNIFVQEGTLRNDGNSANWAGSTANLDVSSGATLDMRADSVTINSLTGAGNITNSFGVGVGVHDVLTVGVSGGSGVFSGGINDGGSGNGDGHGGIALTKLGAGTQTISGTNTYNGRTTISEGTLRIGDGGTTGTLGEGAVTNDAELVFDRSNTIIVSNAISGIGSVTKNGAGTLVLNSQNSYGGPTTITAGTLQLGASQPLALLNSSAIWLDATDGSTINTGGGGVLSWTNKGTLGALGDAVAAVGQEPTFVASEAAMNGNQVIHFESTAGGAPFDRLTNAQDFSAGNVTVMYAGRLSGGNDLRLVSATGNNWLLGTWAGNGESAYFNNGFLYNSVTADTTAHVYTGTIAAGGAASFYVNGALRGNGSGAQGPNGLSLGGGYFLNTNIENSNGDIGEMFVFGSVLSAEERRAVEAYLSHKWAGVGSGNILPSTGAVALTVSGAALDVNGVTQTIGALTGVAGTSIALNDGSLTAGDADDTTYAGAIVGAGAFTKAGSGALTLTGALSMTTLTADEGTLNVNSNAADADVVANAVVNFGVSQTLNSLDIGDGAVVTLGSALAAPAPEFARADSLAVQPAAAVPEPGTLALLLPAILGLLRRPRGNGRKTS